MNETNFHNKKWSTYFWVRHFEPDPAIVMQLAAQRDAGF